jgi:phospholipid-binding lipoprotein MlaA
MFRGFFLLVVIVWLGGCATIATDPRDPWEGWNRDVQSFNDGADEYFLTPVAEGYNWLMPSFASQGVSNIFNNLGDIRVTLNDFLQFKFVQGAEDFTRFLINTTLGVGGLFDVATELDFEQHEEDFGQTLGAWGMPSGPYMVLPILGPSTARGSLGLVGDAAAYPVAYVNAIAIALGITGSKVIDTKASNLSSSRIINAAALDRYEFLRNAYLQRRAYLIRDGSPSLEDDELLDEDLDLGEDI